MFNKMINLFSFDGFIANLSENITATSYWFCMLGGVIGFILYIFGYKKGKDFPTIAIAIYIIINILKGAILGA